VQLLLVAPGAVLIFSLHSGHAGGVTEVGGLVRAFSAQILYHLYCTRIHDVEIRPLLVVQTPYCKSVNTAQTIHQFGTHLIKLVSRGPPAKVGVVGDQGEGVGALGHLLGGAAPPLPGDAVHHGQAGHG